MGILERKGVDYAACVIEVEWSLVSSFYSTAGTEEVSQGKTDPEGLAVSCVSPAGRQLQTVGPTRLSACLPFPLGLC